MQTLALPHYTPRRMSGGWGFTTPSGQLPGFRSEEAADRAASGAREGDRAEAFGKSGPIPAVLRAYFESIESDS